MNHKKGNVLIWIIVIVVVALGIWFAVKNDTVAPPEDDQSESQAEVNQTGTESPEEATPQDESPAAETSESAPQDGSSETVSEGSETTPSDETGPVTVRYTGDGFEPSQVTIQDGETVRWVNQTDGRMWVASDIHPTHRLYPVTSGDDCLGSSFDQCKGVSSGGTFEFTFSEKGQWGYHNHVNASDRGRVIVE